MGVLETNQTKHLHIWKWNHFRQCFKHIIISPRSRLSNRSSVLELAWLCCSARVLVIAHLPFHLPTFPAKHKAVTKEFIASLTYLLETTERDVAEF